MAKSKLLIIDCSQIFFISIFSYENAFEKFVRLWFLQNTHNICMYIYILLIYVFTDYIVCKVFYILIFLNPTENRIIFSSTVWNYAKLSAFLNISILTKICKNPNIQIRQCLNSIKVVCIRINQHFMENNLT